MPIQFSDRTKHMALGAVIGAVALAMIGYSWDFFLTPAEQEAMADRRAKDAVAAAVAPYCVARFQREPDAQAKLAELRKTEQWSRAAFIEKGGWAKAPDGKSPDSTVAAQCAEALLNPAIADQKQVVKP